MNIENLDKSNQLLSYVNIFLLANRLQTIMDRNLNEISSKQWIALIMLGTFEEPPTLKELALKCGITHQSTMQLVKKLQEKGYVSIEPDKKDKRAIRIVYTQKRELWTDQYAQENEKWLYAIFSDLTEEELQIFCSAQFKIYDRLGQIEENGGYYGNKID